MEHRKRKKSGTQKKQSSEYLKEDSLLIHENNKEQSLES